MNHPVHRFYAALEARAWTEVAALLAPDMIYELPQSRERISGRADYVAFNVAYPGAWHLSVERVVGSGSEQAVWLTVTTGADVATNLAWLTLDDAGLITRLVDFWPQPSEPPPHRPPYVERGWHLGHQ